MSLKPSLLDQGSTGEADIAWRVLEDDSNRNKNNMSYTAEVTAAALTSSLVPNTTS